MTTHFHLDAYPSLDGLWCVWWRAEDGVLLERFFAAEWGAKW